MNSTELNWSKFEPLFGSWADKFKPFFLQGGFDDIYEYLKASSARGKVICPTSENVFRCFTETPYDEVKCILVAMSPYHSLYNRKPIADGLPMSCSITGKLQPSLSMWYDELSRVYNTNVIREPDLSYLAHSGCLMLNAGLTCEAMKAGSHNIRWGGFMQYLFEEVLVTVGMPVIFLGRDAQKLEKYVAPFSWIFSLSHPVSASYSGTEWSSEGMFLAVDKILKENNNTSIKWYKTE